MSHSDDSSVRSTTREIRLVLTRSERQALERMAKKRGITVEQEIKRILKEKCPEIDIVVRPWWCWW
jgi:hypothetical protein